MTHRHRPSNRQTSVATFESAVQEVGSFCWIELDALGMPGEGLTPAGGRSTKRRRCILKASLQAVVLRNENLPRTFGGSPNRASVARRLLQIRSR